MNVQAVRDAIATVAKCPVSNVTDNKRLTEDLGIRSLGRVELLALIGESVGVDTTSPEVAGAETVGEIILRLKEHSA